MTALVGLCLASCAHSITITPELDPALKAGNPSQALKVGYYIDPVLRETEVVTDGGGGDNAAYYPYRDLEFGLFSVLRAVFPSVARLESGDPALLGEGLDALISTTIHTTSSGGVMMWAPDSFGVVVTCRGIDRDGRQLFEVSGTGQAGASSSELMSDPGAAGRKAAARSLLDLRRQLDEL
ncbi:MAG: hypothetical protein P1V81_18690, partial [Planctomycetota bacterium]|nr:hypothetical protein [Planctomycetota bacterium]